MTGNKAMLFTDALSVSCGFDYNELYLMINKYQIPVLLVGHFINKELL
jgi:hypothetical protein